MLTAVAGLSVLIWIYLCFARGKFWASTVDDNVSSPPASWPSVAVVIPARNEAESIGASANSLLRQDYPGELTIFVVDDDSSDDTAAIARAAARDANAESRMHVIDSRGLPSGWTGKLWAVNQGVEAALAQSRPDYLLLTDADIVHSPGALNWLVAKAVAGQFTLTSLLAKLRCESFIERVHVPAFVFFFQMLYPFSWVCNPRSSMAGAAGGCMLVRTDALEAVGGVASIRGALIDDCALGKKMKSQGPIWLGLTERIKSLRAYENWDDARQMVSRTAYAQLRNSLWLLAGTTLGMALTFVLPPLLAIFGQGWDRYLGLAAWLIMALLFQPTLRFYKVSPLWALALPAIALLYSAYTINSAYRHWRRQGGAWKGRVYTDALNPQ